MTVYIALLRKDPASDYGVDFPDFPGCVTAGSTVEEAVSMASEALLFHVEGMIEDGLEVPDPSPLEGILADRHNRKAVPLLVPVDLPGKAVRVNVMVPDRDLRAIDRYAKRHGMTRSGFLVSAARRAMGGPAS